MPGENYREIPMFFAVARARSFTRAAEQLGVSQSALSHTIRSLEIRLGVRLLTRTTRSVAPTEAGERLIQKVAPRLKSISEALEGFEELRDEFAGSVRITASEFAANNVLWPKLSKLQRKHPHLKIELEIKPGLTDIVTERFDAGVRFGDQISKGMSAVRISRDIRMVIVGAPVYLERHPAPTVPAELTSHECINMRFSSRGEVYAWELKKGRQQLEVRVGGAWTFNSVEPAIKAALAGYGLAYTPEELALPYIKDGRFLKVLSDWSPTIPGLHLFYATGRKVSPALSLIIEALRYRSQRKK